ncbi:hypothetical protein CsSME_00019595 [Camellia sinensis var. sinensis]
MDLCFLFGVVEGAVRLSGHNDSSMIAAKYVQTTPSADQVKMLQNLSILIM